MEEKHFQKNRSAGSKGAPGSDTDLEPVIEMVTKALSTIQEYPTRERILEVLPQKISRSELDSVIDRLVESNTIMIDKDGTLVWIAVDSPELAKLFDESNMRPLA